MDFERLTWIANRKHYMGLKLLALQKKVNG